MSAELHGKVRYATGQLLNNPTYAQNAAHESMQAYLADWELAAAKLDASITLLRSMYRARLAAEAAGEWP